MSGCLDKSLKNRAGINAFSSTALPASNHLHILSWIWGFVNLVNLDRIHFQDCPVFHWANIKLQCSQHPCDLCWAHWADSIWNFHHTPVSHFWVLMISSDHVYEHIYVKLELFFLPVHHFTFIYIEFYTPFYYSLTYSLCSLSPLILTTLNNLNHQ